ncbi:GPI-anchored surface protein, putative [Bodo saltans]|uniref:GPI-anchored surface protein, putative n=1 Tax=Bodo saltans TaxID=75058 RepID=A0A0S4JCB4_BODSA|nr:GPI-anchored surface protein, putative [Bodo saltans]|eukprot:CUG87126.1 GPI-anchored surface protein, putative [Bodo saltans]
MALRGARKVPHQPQQAVAIDIATMQKLKQSHPHLFPICLFLFATASRFGDMVNMRLAYSVTPPTTYIIMGNFKSDIFNAKRGTKFLGGHLVHTLVEGLRRGRCMSYHDFSRALPPPLTAHSFRRGAVTFLALARLTKVHMYLLMC